MRRFHRVGSIDLKSIKSGNRIQIHDDEDPFNQYLKSQIFSYCNDKMKMFKCHKFKDKDETSLCDYKVALLKYIYDNLLLITNIEYDYMGGSFDTTWTANGPGASLDIGTFTSNQLVNSNQLTINWSIRID